MKPRKPFRRVPLPGQGRKPIQALSDNLRKSLLSAIALGIYSRLDAKATREGKVSAKLIHDAILRNCFAPDPVSISQVSGELNRVLASQKKKH